MKKFSVIVPFYNAEPTIERTLASFISNKDFIKEVVLVNDGSTDNTLSKIDNFKCFYDIKIIDNQGNKGPGPARKTGLLAAEGEWVTFVDADDCLIPFSLYYVNKQLEENNGILLLHTQSMFHETGTFDLTKGVKFSDYSCGGNFYKREYLIKHNLFPHDELFMVEDEYFNHIVKRYIEFNAKPNSVRKFNYPVYQVHRDKLERLSFSYSNWVNYITKYRILFVKYYAEFFKDEKNITHINTMKKVILCNYAFCYCLYQSLLFQKNKFEFDEKQIIKDFYDVLQYIIKIYNITTEDVITFFYENPELMLQVYEATFSSVGCKFNKNFAFRKFIEYVIEQNETIPIERN